MSWDSICSYQLDLLCELKCISIYFTLKKSYLSSIDIFSFEKLFYLKCIKHLLLQQTTFTDIFDNLIYRLSKGRRHFLLEWTKGQKRTHCTYGFSTQSLSLFLSLNFMSKFDIICEKIG